ncbi:PA14 domain-containing protein [Streptomyces beijiangensis]|uniref:Cellulose 1,4-beta-cellobiosidase n=1 Tax=Streptomyces beijiangensis TaxID=163361 RepID=A0A939JES4_9ACTN|nr:PA14 domain-containing protein [Streptomyces beijiangensis]MBO0513376.1 cellulose 1,4-beta-cellobiosidase [Streptomyces beijiangensis]
MPQRLSAALLTATALAAGLALPATAQAATTVNCAAGGWKATYYANTSFSGTPKRTVCDSSISENYGTGDPAGVTLPKDNFTVRWATTRNFGSGGPFALTTEVRDGIRVYLDGVRKMDVWKNVSTTQKKTVNLTVPKGTHTLRVDFVAWTGSANVKFAYAPRTSATVDKTAPLTPTGAKAVLDNATAQARVSWAANKEMDLAGYRVYRRLKGSTAFTRVAQTTGTSFAQVPSMPGSTYYYEVRAYDKAGRESTGTADLPITTYAVTSPTGLTAKGTDAGIALAWKPVPGAVMYDIVRLDDHGENAYFSTKSTGSYTDTKVARSVKWSYRVSSRDGAGRFSQYDAHSVEARRLVAAPRNVTAVPATGKVVLNWATDAATGGDYFAFHVYRSTTLPVDTTAEPVKCAYSREPSVCTDTSAAMNTTYHYVVKGYDDTGDESLASAPVTVTTLGEDRTPPAPVAGLRAEATEYGIVLHWNANTEADLKRYEIYRGEVIGDPGEQVCSAGQYDFLSPATTSYLDDRLPDGEEVCYFVDAIDQSGNSSFKWTGDANVAVVTELDLTPSVATPEGSPVTASAMSDEGGTAIRLDWQPVQDATGYRVYRWNPTTLTYEKLTADPFTDTTYMDTAAGSGTTHFYWVSAVYADGRESAPGAAWEILPPKA